MGGATEKSVADAEVLLRYGKSNGWLDGQPSVVPHAFGEGRITYIGAVLDDKLYGSAAKWMTHESRHARVWPSADGVEVSRPWAAGKQIPVLINFAAENRRVALPRSMKLLLDGKSATPSTYPLRGGNCARPIGGWAATHPLQFWTRKNTEYGRRVAARLRMTEVEREEVLRCAPDDRIGRGQVYSCTGWAFNSCSGSPGHQSAGR